MKKGELRELYQMMFPEYPDIVTVKELREMLGISRKLAYCDRVGFRQIEFAPQQEMDLCP